MNRFCARCDLYDLRTRGESSRIVTGTHSLPQTGLAVNVRLPECQREIGVGWVARVDGVLRAEGVLVHPAHKSVSAE